MSFVLAAAAACDRSPSADAHKPNGASRGTPYKITCTVGMVADIVREIAGEKAVVSHIIGESVDPHLYQASRSDLVTLMGADIDFYSGLHLEGKMVDALEQVGRKLPVYAVTDGIAPERLMAPPEFAGQHDPHVWMDARLWKDAASFVADALGEFDESNAAYYQGNYERLAKKMDALDAYAKSAIATIPESSRILVTAHDAFHYFGRAYGIEVRGIQGISTESEAGVKDVNELVNLLVERKIRAVFVESSISAKNVTALVEGAASRGHPVEIGGTLYSDAMGRAGTYEGTYIGMIDHNVTTIVRALGGEAPERGMSGRLTN
jgi:manganese/zinc/iron transport system substrate-binding protein